MDPDNSPIGKSITQAQREEELERFGTFPLYPTGVFSQFELHPERSNVTMLFSAFLLACNVVLEVTGESSQIQRHFESKTTTSKTSNSGFFFGPFKTETTNSKESKSSASCDTTANGCRYVLGDEGKSQRRLIICNQQNYDQLAANHWMGLTDGTNSAPAPP